MSIGLFISKITSTLFLSFISQASNFSFRGGLITRVIPVVTKAPITNTKIAATKTRNQGLPGFGYLS
jgi:hypothetical protein